DGIEQLPHDLWASADLPPLSVTQRLTLLAAQFDLTFRLEENGRAASLVAWPDKPAIERSYTSGTHSRELAAEWQALAPRSTLRVEGAKIIVRGPLEDHERIADSRKPAARPTRDGKPAGVQVHTLDLRGAPLDRVLESLRKQLDLQIEIDDSVAQAKIDMRQNVSFKVEQASLDQLLAAALKPAGLSFTRQGTKVHVFPAAK
ncbi:MAG TPA: STN domain-containing protein, partial [Pirellulales bacterium]|nr:STN domain-containing protein [Pirellulales bacterium]